MTGGEKDKQHKRYMTGCQKFIAAAEELGSW